MFTPSTKWEAKTHALFNVYVFIHVRFCVCSTHCTLVPMMHMSHNQLLPACNNTVPNLMSYIDALSRDYYHYAKNVTVWSPEKQTPTSQIPKFSLLHSCISYYTETKDYFFPWFVLHIVFRRVLHGLFFKLCTVFLYFSFVSVAEIGFIVNEYSVSESESAVEVCVGITNGQPLDQGYGSATVNIVTESVSATGKPQ